MQSITEWFDMYLYMIRRIVEWVFGSSLGELGFSLGDVEIALLLIGLVASAFVAKFSHLGVRHDFTIGSGSGSKSND